MWGAPAAFCRRLRPSPLLLALLALLPAPARCRDRLGGGPDGSALVGARLVADRARP